MSLRSSLCGFGAQVAANKKGRLFFRQPFIYTNSIYQAREF
ncbi:hypothetical protein O59_001935 [Cellvibrio sp. BR]|nr:hypothetical protein O59_001935 [Cellvibrio sp. BR]